MAVNSWWSKFGGKGIPKNAGELTPTKMDDSTVL